MSSSRKTESLRRCSPWRVIFSLGACSAGLAAAATFSGCGSANMEGGEVGMGIVEAPGTAAANKQPPGVPVPEEIRAWAEPTPESEQDPMGSYNPDPPLQFTADSRKITNSDWVLFGGDTSKASNNPMTEYVVAPLYVFQTSGDLHGIDAGGGVVLEGAWVVPWHKSPLYNRFSFDVAYYHAAGRETADGRGGAFNRYGIHLNGGGGVVLGDFELFAWTGVGFGITGTRRTAYNAEGALSSRDFDFQAGTRVSYRLSRYARIFAGYRFIRVFSSRELRDNGEDDDDNWSDSGDWGGWDDWSYGSYAAPSLDPDTPRRDTPHLNAHAVEIGVSFVF